MLAPVVVLPRRSRIVLVIVLCVGAILLALATTSSTFVLVVVVALFAAVVLNGLLSLIPSRSFLALDHDGVRVRSPASDESVPWNRVARVSLARSRSTLRAATSIVLLAPDDSILLAIDASRFGDPALLEDALRTWHGQVSRSRPVEPADTASIAVANAAPDPDPVAGTPTVTRVVAALVIAATAVEFARFGMAPTQVEVARAGGSSIGAVANGEWWKLLSANVLHGNLVHVAMNMFVFVQVGAIVEMVLGRMVLLSGLAWAAIIGSIAAVWTSGGGVTVGASGMVFGIFGVALAADPRARTFLGRMAWQLIPLNLIITFVVPGISKGGHLGGLVAGALVGLACCHGGRVRAASVRRLVLVLGVTLAIATAIPPFVLSGSRATQLQAGVVAPLLEHLLGGGATCTAQERSSTRYACIVNGRERAFRFGQDDLLYEVGVAPSTTP